MGKKNKQKRELKRKKERTRNAGRAATEPPVERLDEISDLLDDGEVDAAEEALDALARRFPDHADVLGLRMDIAVEDGNWNAAADHGTRYLAKRPDEAEVAFNVVGAYLHASHLILGQQVASAFLERFPDHPRAKDVRGILEMLNEDLHRRIEYFSPDPAEAFELGASNDRVTMLIALGRTAEARELCEKMLARRPTLAAPQNNIAVCFWEEGQPAQALEITERLLALEPENVHALANAIQYLIALGREGDARERGKRLLASRQPAANRTTKIAEALTLLGDDEALAAMASRAEPRDDEDPYFQLFVGVAQARLGRDAAAKRHLTAALELAPELEVAEDSLEDLELPAHRRQGAWALEVGSWMPRALVAEVSERMGAAAGSEIASRRAATEILAAHAAWIHAAPALIERGGPNTRALVLMLAELSRDERLVEVFRRFALSQLGPDQPRIKIALSLSREKLLGPGPHKLWIRGNWDAIALIEQEIHGEPEPGTEIAPEAEQIMRRALNVLHKHPAKAEALIRQALVIQPDNPSLLNNLVGAMALQRGREAEVDALKEANHARYPDSVIATCTVALKRAGEGKMDEAQEMLRQPQQRKRLHVSEFAALSAAQAKLMIARGEFDQAADALARMEEVCGDSVVLEQLLDELELAQTMPRPTRHGSHWAKRR